jgi:hypothetical protein
VFNEGQHQCFGTEQHIGGCTARNKELIADTMQERSTAMPDGNPVLTITDLHFINQSCTSRLRKQITEDMLLGRHLNPEDRERRLLEAATRGLVKTMTEGTNVCVYVCNSDL